MRKPLLVAVVVFIIAATVSGKRPAWQPTPGHTTNESVANGAPGAQPNSSGKVDLNNPQKDKRMPAGPIIRLGNVSTPTLTVYPPKITTS